MRTFAANFTAELAAETAAFVLLLEIETATPVYYTSCDIPVVTGGKRYTPREFAIPRIAAGSGLSVGSIEIEFASVDQLLAALFLGEDVAGAGVLLSIAAMGSDYRVVTDGGSGDALSFTADDITFGAAPLTFGSGGSDIVMPWFRGLVSTYDLDETDLTVTVVNELILWSKKTLRKCQASCPWPFKGDECGYSGAATWCDQSWTRCTALANTASYGGFRFIRATMEKEIKWGRN
jgi:hypothetical protein